MLKYLLGLMLVLTPAAQAADYMTLPGVTGYARFSPRADQLLRLEDRRLEIWSF